MQLDALFRPTSIAVIGASDKPTIGRRLITSLDRIGSPAGSFRSTRIIQPCSVGWPSIAKLPETPDVVLFCMGHERVLDAFPHRGVRPRGSPAQKVPVSVVASDRRIEG
jgi:acetate---CoA ligase (ADP-forming)